MNAIFSDDQKYRYVLRRQLKTELIQPNKLVLFVMLNPSIANAIEDDNTIRQCIKFATREGGTWLTVVNLFSLVSTDPSELFRHPGPIGPENDRYLAEEIARHKDQLIVAAWGSHKLAVERAKALTQKHGPFKCLGMNKGGSPKHPLYLTNKTPLMNYDSA